MEALYKLSARKMVEKLKAGDVSPTQAVTAAYDRIAEVEPIVRALPTLCQDRAYEAAARLESTQSQRDQRRDDPRWLAGLPVAIKDLVDVAGVRTTYGSPIYKDHIPDRSNILVERLEENGAIVIGKSNTPEFGAGGNTFNEIFPTTVTPWDSRMTSGGSSGGAAAALASGEVWLATGSDLGGSLRTPASFCGIVGLRPSPGRVAAGPSPIPFNTLSVEGPMARTVGDTALFLDAMAGEHPVDPMSLQRPTAGYQSSLMGGPHTPRVGYNPDLGVSVLDPDVRRVCDEAINRLAKAGWDIVETTPDFGDAMTTFQVLRAASFATGMADVYNDYKDLLKPDIIWNIEKGLAQTVDVLGAAERARGALYHRIADFFDSFDLMICSTACTPPFPIENQYLARMGDHVFENYMEWLALPSVVTVTSCPVLSLPCGTTGNELPVGLQIIGRPRGERELLAAAARAESVLGMSHRVPLNPVVR